MKGASHRFGIVRIGEGRDHGRVVRARPRDLPNRIKVDATNGDQGEGQLTAKAREDIQAGYGIGALFCFRRKNGTEAKDGVILTGSGPGLLDGMRASPKRERRSDASRRFDREILLTEVGAVCAEEEREIEAIVDDKRDAGPTAKRPKFAPEPQSIPIALRLIPVLKERRPAGHDRFGELEGRTGTGMCGVDDGIQPATLLEETHRSTPSSVIKRP